jgi:hypothetical protein
MSSLETKFLAPIFVPADLTLNPFLFFGRSSAVGLLSMFQPHTHNTLLVKQSATDVDVLREWAA